MPLTLGCYLSKISYVFSYPLTHAQKVDVLVEVRLLPVPLGIPVKVTFVERASKPVYLESFYNEP